MTPSELNTELTAIGMNAKQSALYLAALQLGTAPASRIAASAELNRATAYHLLEEMVQAKYVTASDRFGIRHYTAVAPQQLLALLEERRMELARMQERLTGVVGDLESLRKNATVQPTVRLYDGRVGLKDVLRRTLRAVGPIRMWDMTGTHDESIRKFLYEELVPERIARGISSKILVTELNPSLDHVSALREVRLLPNMALDVDIRVYNDTTTIVSYAPEELFGVEIESPYVAKAMKGMFDAIWSMLPDPTKKADAPLVTEQPVSKKKSPKKRALAPVRTRR